MQQGPLVKKLRIFKKLSQQVLADKVGIKQPYLSEIERSTKTMSVDTLHKMCNALDVSVGTFTLLSLENNDFKANELNKELFDSIKPDIRIS